MNFPNPITLISDEVSQELPVIRRFLGEFGLPGFELRSFNGRAFKDLTDADVTCLARASRDEGWRVFGCSTPVFKCQLDDREAILHHTEIFQRSLEIAHNLDCDLLRVFTFLREPGGLSAERLEPVVERLLQLAERAAGSNVRLGIENEHSCLVATATEMNALLERLPERFGAIWDPCNVLYLPDTPGPSPKDCRLLLNRLHHVHAKDAVRRKPEKGKLPAVAVPIGAGEVDWRAHLVELRRIGYQGAISLETHWRLDEADEALLHLPAGYAFSQGGETASRTCLHTLQAIAQTI